MLGGSAWFWSRAALAARFGIDDGQRSQASAPDFDWVAFTWLPRLMLVATFLVGVVIAIQSRSFWTIAGAVVLGGLALLLTIVRPSSAHRRVLRRRLEAGSAHGSAAGRRRDCAR